MMLGRPLRHVLREDRLYHNDHGVFTEVAEKAGVAGSGKAWVRVCFR